MLKFTNARKESSEYISFLLWNHKGESEYLHGKAMGEKMMEMLRR